MSKARIFDLENRETYRDSIKAASDAILSGGIVVFPTETVYGLGADATSGAAVRKIFEAKGRPPDNPLIVHIAGISQLRLYAKDVPPEADALAKRFMPGPLTLVLNKKSGICSEATVGLSTVAMRVPSSQAALDLLAECKRPIAAPSANLSGKPSPTRPEHVLQDMQDRADVILLGGSCSVGVESTVLDCTCSPFAILRPGAIGLEDIAPYAESRYSSESTDSPKSPGMKYRHYKPEAFVVALDLTPNQAARYLSSFSDDGKSAYFLFDETPDIGLANVFSLGRYSVSEDAAKMLYWALREADRGGFSKAYVMCPSESSIGKAVRDRLFRAADLIVNEQVGK